MRTTPLAVLVAALVVVGVSAPAAGAAVSPTATLAYVVYPKVAAAGEVWAAQADGSARHRLATKATLPLVSPDGTQVLFVTTPATGTPVLKVVPAAGGAARTLATGLAAGGGGATAWAPDGKHVVTVTGPEIGKQSLVLVDVATGTAKTVATGYFSGASFSPDSASLVYGRTAKQYQQGFQGDLFVEPVAGGLTRKLTTDGHSISPVWGPKAIVYSHTVKAKKKGDAPKANLFLVQPDGSGRHALTKLKIPFLLFGLTAVAWSADGGQLAAEYGGQDFSEGYAVNPVSGKARGLSTKKLQVDAYGISRDGSTILGATGGYDPGDRHDVVSVPYAGGAPKVIVKKAWSPSWSG